MENLSNHYSSSSSSSSPASSTAESEGSNDFRVISVSAIGTLDSNSQRPETNDTPTIEGSLKPPLPLHNTSIPADQLKSLERWVESFYQESQKGPAFTEIVRKNKNFRNPAIFEKMISYCGIDEFGTNIKGRKSLDQDEYYKNICDVQELCMKDTD